MSRTVTAASVVAGALAAHAGVNSRLLRTPPASVPVERPVSVLLPVRNEAGVVRHCVEALLHQTDVPDLQIVVLDDGSTDGTADVVRRCAQGDPRVRVLSGTAPPPGWLGKAWACRQAADAATGDVLVFVDADVVLAPDAVARTVAMLGPARRLVSPYPRQVAVGLLERLVQPLLQWSWLTFLPLRLAEGPYPSLSAANGQLLAVDATAYRAVGGHAAVRADIVEDIALLRELKRVGLRGGVVDGTCLATCRMYAGAKPLVDGYAKSLWAAFGSPAGAAAVLALLDWVFVLPALAALRGSRMGLAGYAAGVVGRAVSARRTGGQVLPDALAHPVSVLALNALTVVSWRRRVRGAITWKGRPLP